jgi:hypothetical protein
MTSPFFIIPLERLSCHFLGCHSACSWLSPMVSKSCFSTLLLSGFGHHLWGQASRLAFHKTI